MLEVIETIACDGFFRDVTGVFFIYFSISQTIHHSSREFLANRIEKYVLTRNQLTFFSLCVADISRLDKSPLLANGYNAPPTHLNHMPFMQMGHGGPMMSSGMPPHLPRPDGSMMKNPNIPGMEAITR